MRRSHRLSPVLVLVPAICFAAALAGQTVPNPRPNGWVTDTTGSLPPSTVAEIDRLGDRVKAQTGAELAVVVVPTTNGVPAHDYALGLFNSWRIGGRGHGDGVLVFAALGDRKAEIILGNGVDSAEQVRESEAVMQGEMVPRFRAGDPAGAVLHGAAKCARRILGADVALAEPAPAAATSPKALPFATEPAAEPVLPEPPRPVLQPSSPPAAPPFEVPENDWGFLFSFFSVVALLVAGIWLKFRPALCPQCSARTLRWSDTTIREATYFLGGLVQRDYACASCFYRSSETYRTPLLVERDHASSSPSPDPSSGFSSSSSSSPASDSSSGFGGGSSSGSGASGSW